MMQDTNPSISITNKEEHSVAMYKTQYTRNTHQNTSMYNWTTSYPFIQWFFKLYEKLLYSKLQRKLMTWIVP